MAKAKVVYSCSACGATHNGWSGRCSVCGKWNTITEQIDVRSTDRVETAVSSGTKLKPVALNASSIKNHKRITVGINDIDAVLGGGIVPASVTLIAGQPGIGKSTLLLQLAYNISKNNSVLYVSGEESADQVAARGQRLKAVSDNLQLATSTSANDIAATISKGEYDVIVVDSIQTISANEITGVPGSTSQVTNCTQLLSVAAKKANTALILVGHVTKEGSIAGPKVLEHVVDTVLQLEGDRYGGFRVLRGVKNRFGSTNEAAILEMEEAGLKVVDNPSAALLSERQVSDGSVVLATLEGTRPILVEVQALVNTTSYGYPKRAAAGVDINRLNLLVAMLERRTKLKLSDKDIYINIVGGIKLTEPAGDLAICMAIASATKGMQLKDDAVVFGEVGLSGEIRHVPWLEKRLAEAKKLGFKTAIGPSSHGKKYDNLKAVKNIKDALNNHLSS